MGLISNEELIEILREKIARHGGPTLYSKHLGVSCAFVSRMATGKKFISGRVLDDLGYERVVCFRPAMRGDGASSASETSPMPPRETGSPERPSRNEPL